MRTGRKRTGKPWHLMCGIHGDEMVEASIVIPIIILIVVLMLRLFAFYLEVLAVQVTSHVEAAQLWNGYDKVAIRTYRDKRTVTLAAGGLLKDAVIKDITTETYLFNEDLIIRTGNLFPDK